MGRFDYSVFSEHYRFMRDKVACLYGMLFIVIGIWVVHHLICVSNPSLNHSMASFIFNVEV
jgi:hypothetical protein